MMNEKIFSQKLHTRFAAIIMVAVAVIYIFLFGKFADDIALQTDFGVGLSSELRWSMSPYVGMALNVLFNVAIIAMLILINKTFNVLRAMTWLQVGLFALMQSAVPYGVMSLNSGSLVCLVVLICLFLMFRNYGMPNEMHGVFLTFLYLSSGATVQYCFLFFIPLFWLICVQMRIFTLKTALASTFGLLTVWIILLGFGIIEWNDIRFPEITSVFGTLELNRTLYLLVVACLTSFLLLVSIMMNVFKTMAYNARARAYNGALTLVSAVCIVAMIVNYNNLMAYIPLLNACAAYQITHYFVNHHYDRQYLGVLAVVSVYIILYIWRLNL